MPRSTPSTRTPIEAARPEELRLLEALLFASAEPLDEATLTKRMPDGVDVKVALAQLQADYASRGVNLVRVANKWTFRTADDLSWLMTRESTETRRLSRAAIEMLRDHRLSPAGDARRDRGDPRRDHVKGTLDVLLETGWIRPRGRRKTPGRPLTFGTTEAFLSQFGLEALGDLPGLEELKGTGLLDRAAAFRLQRADAVRRSWRCARTRIRWRPAILWNSCWRRPPSPKRALEAGPRRHPPRRSRRTGAG